MGSERYFGAATHLTHARPQIRSLSTYGSLAITSLNVLLFIITILLVEPWKRKRLVEGVEARCVGCLTGLSTAVADFFAR